MGVLAFCILTLCLPLIAACQHLDTLASFTREDFQRQIAARHHASRNYRTWGYIGIATGIAGSALVQSPSHSSSALPTLVLAAGLGGGAWCFNKAIAENYEADKLDWESRIRFAGNDSLSLIQAQQAFRYFTRKARNSRRIGYIKLGISAALIGSGVDALSHQQNQLGDVVSVFTGAGLIAIGLIPGLLAPSSFHHAKMYEQTAADIIKTGHTLTAGSLSNSPMMQIQLDLTLSKKRKATYPH
ncbi:MAG: hypothetical protein IRZ01_02315 [Thermoflavifilum aggregans]|nr:hypothetical protein [Thermoflavifilum aggregans]